jgi:hypothetical protein
VKQTVEFGVNRSKTGSKRNAEENDGRPEKKKKILQKQSVNSAIEHKAGLFLVLIIE